MKTQNEPTNDGEVYTRTNDAVLALSLLLKGQDGKQEASLTARALGTEGEIFFGTSDGRRYFWNRMGPTKKSQGGFREPVSLREALDAFSGAEGLPQFLRDRLKRLIDESKRPAGA